MRRSRSRSIPNWLIGIALLVVLVIGSYLAFTKNVPWGGGTEVRAVFRSGHDLRPDSPVRIAGVEVGEVTSVEPLAESDVAGSDVATSPATANGAGAVVTMELQDEGLPLKEDAQFSLRPRLFLEGNLFVDVKPGSPSAPVADSDYVFPPQQTSHSVQLDEILTGVFPSDVRRQLQVFLDQFGNALIAEGGGESLRRFNQASAGAFESTAQVSEALLGTKPHDLSSLIFNLNRVLRGLNGNDDALADLITNLRVATGSFAAQDVALERAIAELPRTLEAGDRAFTSLNAAFPPTRAFAREILPGIRTAPATLDAATPLLAQLRGLAQPSELRGLAADLRPMIPQLARLTRATVPFMEQTRALSSCFNHTILPWANDRVSGGPAYDAEHGSHGAVYQETAYGLVGINGESRSGDANGQYIRVAGGGGTNTVQTDLSSGELLAGVTPLPIEGSMPPLAPKTRFRPGAPCENQDPPNLTAAMGPAPPQPGTTAGLAPAPGSAAAPLVADADGALTGLGEAARADEQGDGAEARKLQRRAMRDLRHFYATYGQGVSR
ncbi:MAG TPA: MlaD family protein [Solirubrobacterales bacterium]|nr:MlaD family protein [Solirubrobacterales bacterium]